MLLLVALVSVALATVASANERLDAIERLCLDYNSSPLCCPKLHQAIALAHTNEAAIKRVEEGFKETDDRISSCTTFQISTYRAYTAFCEGQFGNQVGPKGPKGDTGDMGQQPLVNQTIGPKGGIGIPGNDGPQGAEGPGGVRGHGGGGGPNGPQGPPGPKGAMVGVKGPGGIKGCKGDPGNDGIPGTPGPKGDTGGPGSDGDSGESGPDHINCLPTPPPPPTTTTLAPTTTTSEETTTTEGQTTTTTEGQTTTTTEGQTTTTTEGQTTTTTSGEEETTTTGDATTTTTAETTTTTKQSSGCKLEQIQSRYSKSLKRGSSDINHCDPVPPGVLPLLTIEDDINTGYPVLYNVFGGGTVDASVVEYVEDGKLLKMRCISASEYNGIISGTPTLDVSHPIRFLMPRGMDDLQFQCNGTTGNFQFMEGMPSGSLPPCVPVCKGSDIPMMFDGSGSGGLQVIVGKEESVNKRNIPRPYPELTPDSGYWDFTHVFLACHGSGSIISGNDEGTYDSLLDLQCSKYGSGIWKASMLYVVPITALGTSGDIATITYTIGANDIECIAASGIDCTYEYSGAGGAEYATFEPAFEPQFIRQCVHNAEGGSVCTGSTEGRQSGCTAQCATWSSGHGMAEHALLQTVDGVCVAGGGASGGDSGLAVDTCSTDSEDTECMCEFVYNVPECDHGASVDECATSVTDSDSGWTALMGWSYCDSESATVAEKLSGATRCTNACRAFKPGLAYASGTVGSGLRVAAECLDHTEPGHTKDTINRACQCTYDCYNV